MFKSWTHFIGLWSFALQKFIRRFQMLRYRRVAFRYFGHITWKSWQALNRFVLCLNRCGLAESSAEFAGFGDVLESILSDFIWSPKIFFFIILAEYFELEFVFIHIINIDEELCHVLFSLFFDAEVTPEPLNCLLTGFLIFHVLFGDLINLGTACYNHR